MKTTQIATAFKRLKKEVGEDQTSEFSFVLFTSETGGSSEDDELSSDLETPPVLTSPAVSSDALKTPVSAVRTAEQQRRLSRGVLASLDSLSQTAAAMNSS